MSRSSRRNGWRNRAMQPPQIPALPEVAGVAGEWVSVLREIRQGLEAAKQAAVGPAPVIPASAVVRPVAQGPWRVAVAPTSATSFTVVDPATGQAPQPLQTTLGAYSNAIVQFLPPSPAAGIQVTVDGFAFANNTLTVTTADPMPRLPASGDLFYVIALSDPIAGLENPFATAAGQRVVSASEGFWARIARMGRLKYMTVDNVALNTGGAWSTWLQGDVAPGYLFYPRLVVATATIATELALVFVPGYTTGGTAISGVPPQAQGVVSPFLPAFLNAGIPLRMEFEGEIWADGDLSYTVELQSKGTTAGGAGTGFIYGFEVAKQYA